MPPPQRLTGSDRLTIDSVCTRFEEKWPSVGTHSIEICLGEVAHDLRSELLRELIAVEIELRVQRHEQPRAADYLTRFPDNAIEIEQAFADMQTALLNEATLINAPLPLAQAATVEFRSPTTDSAASTHHHADIAELKLPGYRVDGLLGRGGMGMVLRCWDEKLHRAVAIKVLLPQLTSDGNFRQRFMQEARASAAIRHPNVVTLFAVEEQNEPPFLVFELVEGESLAARLEATPTLSIDEVVTLAIDLAAGLAAAHARGIVHRDIKPGNVLLDATDGRARLTDFGLARVTSMSGLTTTGNIAGTPQYMSPEQVEGRTIDHRSDLFSLGAVLYRMVSGQPAFAGDSVIALARQICDRDPAPIRELKPDVPQWLTDIIRRLLAKQPEERLQSASELVQLLKLGDQVSRGGPPQTNESSAGLLARPKRNRIAALSIIAVLIVLGLLFLNRPQTEPSLTENSAANANTNSISHAASPDNVGTVTSKNDQTTKPGVTVEFAAANDFNSPDWEWSEPEHLGVAINSPAGESSPSLSGDGLMLAFISRRTGTPLPYIARRESLEAAFGQAELMSIELSDWKTVRDVGLSNDGLTLAIALGPDTSHLNLHQATRPDRQSAWSKPTLISGVNSPYVENSPKFSADGLRLVFHSNRQTGGGPYDLFEATRASVTDAFGEPQLLAATVSSPTPEENPVLTSDNLGLLFTRDWTNPRLLLATRPSINEPFGEPTPVRIPGIEETIVARAPTLNADGNQMIFSSNRIAGVGDSDLWLTRRVRKVAE